jgi:hypothetical protein
MSLSLTPVHAPRRENIHNGNIKLELETQFLQAKSKPNGV